MTAPAAVSTPDTWEAELFPARCPKGTELYRYAGMFWNRGYDTVDIAEICDVHESEALRLLWSYRYQRDRRRWRA